MSSGAPVADDPRSGLEDLLAAAVVAVDGRDLTGRDLLAAGVVSGRWRSLEDDLRRGLGLVAAEPPPQAEVDELVRRFRLERNLLAAEDLRTWLQARALSFPELKAAAARAVARGRGGTAPPVPAVDLAAALPAEAVVTGALREIAVWLADRLLSTAVRGLDPEPLPLEHPRVQRLVFEEARAVAGAVAAEGGLERARRLGWIASRDDAHAEWETAVTAASEVTRLLHEKELEWSRFELEQLRLASVGAAAEAARQLAEGVEASSVAAAAGVPVTAGTIVLVDASPELGRLLTGAAAGDVVGPWSDADEQLVARVRAREQPHAGDERSAERARQQLLSDASARLRAGRLRWHDRV